MTGRKLADGVTDWTLEQGLAAPTTDLPHRPAVYARFVKMQRDAGMDPIPLRLITSDYPQAQYHGTVLSGECLAITEGLNHLLSDRELSAVLAHELKHKQDFWMEPASSAAMVTTLGATGAYLAHRFTPEENKPLAITRRAFVGGLATMGVGSVYMRRDPWFELRADKGGNGIPQDPQGLASALRTIDRWHVDHGYGSQPFNLQRAERLDPSIGNRR